MESFTGQTVVFTKATTSMTRKKVLVCLVGLMAADTKAPGRMGRSMVAAFTLQTTIILSMVCGSTAHVNLGSIYDGNTEK